MFHSAVGEKIADFMAGRKECQDTLAEMEASYMVKAKEQGLIK